MDIPLYIYVIDYVLGVVMYTLIGRSAMNIFQKEDSDFFFMKAFVKLTNPILNKNKIIFYQISRKLFLKFHYLVEKKAFPFRHILAKLA